MPADAVLEAQGLSKRYGAVQALSELTFSVPRGGVYGLIGPNGAGKTTLLRIAMGLVRPQSGQLRLFGGPVGPDNLSRVGGFIESPRFYPFLTALESLKALCLIGGATNTDPRRELDRVGLGEAADRRVGGFSLGMKQRLAIAAALVARPELVILDEPTNGMDPAGIQEMRGLIRDLADKDGVTVVLSSHLLDEVERVCDRVAIIDHGKVVTEGAIGGLLAGQANELVITASPIAAALAIVGAAGVKRGETALAVRLPRDAAPALIAALVAGGVEVFEARWVAADLESVFFQRTAQP